MIQIVKPTRFTRFKRWLRRCHIFLAAGTHGWSKECKHIHSLPETHEPELREFSR